MPFRNELPHVSTPLTDTRSSTDPYLPSIVLALTPILLRDCLQRLISDAGFRIVACADNGPQAIAAALSLQPDVTLVTMNLSPFGGLDVITSIAHARSHLSVVAFTDSDASHDRERAMRAGATSCLSLNDGFAYCQHVLQRAATGDVVLARQSSSGNLTPPLSSSMILSRRQEQVVNLVARGRTVSQIATDMVISQKTVKHHLAAIYTKLGVHNRTDAVMTALRHGIVRV